MTNLGQGAPAVDLGDVRSHPAPVIRVRQSTMALRLGDEGFRRLRWTAAALARTALRSRAAGFGALCLALLALGGDSLPPAPGEAPDWRALTARAPTVLLPHARPAILGSLARLLMPAAGNAARPIPEGERIAVAGAQWRILPRATPLAPAPPKAADAPARALRDIDRAVFPKWSGVMERSYAWDAAFDGDCAEIVGRPCHLTPWQDFIDGLRGRDPLTQLDLVNRTMNEVRYRDDRDNWGRYDYWATPGEFFAFGGDCEDYAIAKYYTLKALGFPPERMQILVLNDKARRLPHAVLVVTLQGQELVLDNLNSSIVAWDQTRHYRPIYSVNEDAYWMHGFFGLS